VFLKYVALEPSALILLRPEGMGEKDGGRGEVRGRELGKGKGRDFCQSHLNISLDKALLWNRCKVSYRV
jgi:hypothetical protein